MPKPVFPTVVASWRCTWSNVIPFFAFPPDGDGRSHRPCARELDIARESD